MIAPGTTTVGALAPGGIALASATFGAVAVAHGRTAGVAENVRPGPSALGRAPGLRRRPAAPYVLPTDGCVSGAVLTAVIRGLRAGMRLVPEERVAPENHHRAQDDRTLHLADHQVPRTETKLGPIVSWALVWLSLGFAVNQSTAPPTSPAAPTMKPAVAMSPAVAASFHKSTPL